MLKNFLLVAIRNLSRNSLYSIVNISGLAIGIVCSVLILLWVADETSFDKFISKSDRLYQVYVNADFDNKINTWRSVPLPTYDAMKNAHSNIANSVVTGWGAERLMVYDEIRVMQDGYYASEEFFDMFEFPFVLGNPQTVLDDPSSIVISEKLASILFKKDDPMGKIIKVENQSSLKVTGVFKDVPGNSSFQFDYMIPWKHRESINEWVVRNRTNWGNYSFQIFVELTNPTHETEVEASIYNMLTENGEDDMPRSFFLHPMLRWRLHSNFEDGKEAGGMSDYVQLFTIIATFILIIACINFMNLATARSEKRAKEVGIRKSLGSSRSQLISQFMGESIFISFVAFTIAILLAQVALPWYNQLVDKTLFIDHLSWQFWSGALLIILATGVISGSYPAFYLSSFNPVKTLKGSIKIGKSATTPRKVLVVLQFGFAILLMISTLVIFKQIELVKNRDLGYNQENLISIYRTDDTNDNYDILKSDLLQSGVVEAVTTSNSEITSINSNNFLGWPGKPESQRVIFTTITTSYDYAKTMGIKMLQGRDFSKEFVTDTAAIIVNQAALDIMKLEDPIGTTLDLWGDKRKLIGVVDDVLMGSPYQAIKPMFLIIDDWGGVVSVRIKKTKDLSASLAIIQEIFEKHNPAYPFEFRFADVEFQKKFTTINMTRKLATLFAILAIFITGLGLFGLATYTAQQRIKEIGIRKVLGASVANLVALISKDFTKLVVISFFLAAPLAWYLLDQYLDRYPVRIDLEWWIFPTTGLVALVFALTIVTNQARRAAQSDPVKSLRNE